MTAFAMRMYPHRMPAPPPALLPLFRSANQVRLLAALLLEPQREFTVAELAAETGVPQPSVSREVTNLLRAGVVTADTRHARRLLRANTDSPIFPELSGLLLKTFGPKAVLEEALRGVPGIERAFVYGSWARRYLGQEGPPPGDVDLIVVGEDVDVRAVRRRVERASADLGRDVEVSVLSPEEWRRKVPFNDHVRRGPRVDLDLRA